MVGLGDRGVVPRRRERPVVHRAEPFAADAVEMELMRTVGRKGFELLRQPEPVENFKTVGLEQFPARNRKERGLAFDDRHGPAHPGQGQGQHQAAHPAADDGDIRTLRAIGFLGRLLHGTAFSSD